ncbi:plasmid replication protein, CyRepA1 family, partial [Limnofasciculus baicalensis]
MERPNHIKSAHWQEWTIESGIDPNLTALNVQSLTGATAYEYLIYSETIPRRNDGRLTDHWLKKYRHLEHGGWYCGTLSDSLWGCFKPNQPRRNRDNKKPIKYEHPPKVATGLFLLKVTLKLWKRIAKRYKVPMPKYLFLYTREKLYELFWKWVIKHNIPVIITEGVKKAAILITKGYVGIAVPGIFNGYRQPKDAMGNPMGNPSLIPELARFATPGRIISFGFDSDKKPRTIANVRKAISFTGSLLEQQGCQVQVIEWKPQLGKGVDDLIVNHGIEVFDAAYLAAKSLAIWKAKQLSCLTYEPSLQVNSRYLDKNIPLPKDAKLVGLKSAKGTGKTELIAQWVAEALHKGQWVLVLTHRIQLGEALCQRFGVPYVTELRDSEIGSLLGYGLCVDSLHPESQARFKAEDWSDGLVILDEAEQVLWHMLNSSTCQKERVPILKSFKTLIKNALTSDYGQVIVSDANLSNLSIEYIKQLAGVDIPPYIIQNDWVHPGWSVYRYGGRNPASLMASLKSHIKKGGKPFVCVSGQKRKSKWSTTTLECFLQKHFPDKRILRIDSESVSDPTHPAYCCISKLNQILLEYDIVIASPSIETGVSIDIKDHFTSVWGITHGICSVWSFLQSLARVRPDVPRHIWAAQRGLGRIGNGSTSVKSLLASVHKLTSANIQLLQTAGYDDLDNEGVFQQESLITWAKMATRINVTMSCYREAVMEALLDEGHTIIDVDAVNQDFHVEDKGHSVDASPVIGTDSSRVIEIDSSRVIEIDSRWDDGIDSSRIIGIDSSRDDGIDSSRDDGI